MSLAMVHAVEVLRRERSGSSLPVIVRATDGTEWFTKLAGSAQGVLPLVAELIVAEIADTLGLLVPARALVTIPPAIPSVDQNDELRDLLDASVGTNVGFAVLEQARNLTRAEYERVPLDVAASVLWLDMLVQNHDRTPANPNMMVRRGRYWLIDHGATLPVHHDWERLTEDTPRQPYAIDHHLLGWAAPVLSLTHQAMRPLVTREVLEAAVRDVPDVWMAENVADAPRRRVLYAAYLWKRLRWMDALEGA
ncbi:MAG: hypothetical protein IT353_11540 [Gemmatimonadaceae bacterium]|nr:hypothetical protein [Gemmatimonadaceae bacterium]